MQGSKFKFEILYLFILMIEILTTKLFVQKKSRVEFQSSPSCFSV